MYAPHFAAALAIKARLRQAPLWALLVAAFLPDLLWIGLAITGIEPSTDPFHFFDEWSHSLISVLLLATAFAAAFGNKGRGVVVAIWAAVLTHFLLDFPIHAGRLALYPHSGVHLGWDLLGWGLRPGWLGPSIDWWLQLGVLLVLLLCYGLLVDRTPAMRNKVIAQSIVLLAAQCFLLLP